MARPEILFPLFAPITSLKGVGKASGDAFERLGIATIFDLLLHLPRSMIERITPEGMLDQHIGDIIRFDAEIGAHHPPARAGLPYRIELYPAQSAQAPLSLIYFSASRNWLEARFRAGHRIALSGRLDEYRGALQIAHPDYVTNSLAEIPAREPLYALSKGLSNGQLRKLIKAALAHLPELPEWHDAKLLREKNWPGFRAALLLAHEGEEEAAREFALARLGYDEIFAHQLGLALLARARGAKRPGIDFDKDLYNRAQAALGFALTGAQKRAGAEIIADLEGESQMFRLLQGDVGSGKTAIAFLAMVAASTVLGPGGAGGQSALLAPTEILAEQHFAKLSEWTSGLELPVLLLTGSDNGRAREEKLASIKSGVARIIIGTHAIFQDNVQFHSLKLAVIDEQHRFGVNARNALSAKGEHVDQLLMSATPIPRSLSMSIFGDMDISVLDELPAGRGEVKTSIISLTRVNALIERLEAAMKAGRQIFWVCPRIGAKAEGQGDAQARFGELAERFGKEKIALVHGQMPREMRRAAMAEFARGNKQILVATTAIEVGVDIRAASIMVIEAAERFGLSQLHQLRGRVGRGEEASDCVLLYHEEMGDNARVRLEVLRASNDGFEIAEADLRMRGPGELDGTAQSGLPIFRVFDFERDEALVGLAHTEARALAANLCAGEGGISNARTLLLHLFGKDHALAPPPKPALA